MVEPHTSVIYLSAPGDTTTHSLNLLHQLWSGRLPSVLFGLITFKLTLYVDIMGSPLTTDPSKFGLGGGECSVQGYKGSEPNEITLSDFKI